MKAAEADRNICAVYGDNAIGEITERKWFSSFKKNRFDISDTPRSGRPSGFDKERLNTLVHNYPYQCIRELENVMNCDHSTIVRHLHSMGKVKKWGVWVTHALSQKQQMSAGGHMCISLLVIDWLVNNIDHSYPLSLLVTVNGVFLLT